MAPSINHLVPHLRNFPLKLGGVTWNAGSCITVVCYVIKFCSLSEQRALSDIITGLDGFAQNGNSGQFTRMFVNTFIRKLQSFFTIPTPSKLCDNDKHLNRNEILAGFMDFLLRILKHEAMVPRFGGRCEGRKEFDLLQKEFTLFIAIVEGTLFQSTHNNQLQEEVNSTLKELEILATETGSFIYSCVFSNPPVSAKKFCSVLDALVEKVRVFNLNIEQRYIRFQQLTKLSETSRPGLVDSFFIVDSLIEDLDNMTIKHHVPNFTLDSVIKGQIETLCQDLEICKPFLKGIQLLQDSDLVLTKLLLHIKDLAYEAEYLIHSHVAQNTPSWYLSRRLPAILHKSQLIRKGLGQMMNGKEIIEGSAKPSTSQPIDPPDAEDYYLSSGFEDEKRNIMGDLIGGPKERTLILIHGMPGLGKTTMASKLYEYRAVCDHFDRRVWSVVSQTFNKRQLIIHILMCLARETKEEEILDWSDENLLVEIYQKLMGRRYLVIFDDVWDIKVLTDFLKHFPDDKNGSRIIVTSRIKDATSMCHPISRTLSPLSDGQCWDLLRKKVFYKDSCPQELLSTGKGIASKCHGIALTVVVTAGILVNLEKTIGVWQLVEERLDAYLRNDQHDYEKVLELSYEYLPHNLRPCFLYLGAFHEDTEISVTKLIWLWIAEGFIPKKEENSPEKIAEMYLLDLINRSLVLDTKRRSDNRIKACRVHDLLHDLCRKKAHELNFMKSTNYGFSIYENHQGLYVPSASLFYWRPLSSHVRSFQGCITQHQHYFFKMALLRVFDSMPIEDMPKLPVYLRYLGINRMPEGKIVCKLVSLEILCIESQKPVCIPPVVLQMVKLRHLVIKKEAEFKNCDRSKLTTNLISLCFVGIHKDDDEEVLRDSHLQKLKCLCGGKREFPVLSSLTKLESLKVVFEFSPERTILLESNFPSTLKKLHISKSAFPWAKLSIIGKLPHLHVLKLGTDAFVGDIWETNDDEFKTLWFLKIESPNFKKWTTNSEHFPILRRFVLTKCYALSKIPSEIGDINTLQSIELNECAEGVYMSALEIEKSQHDYGNAEPQVLITSSKWTNEQLRQKHSETSEEG